MKFDKNMLLLYAVTDRAWEGKQSLYEQVEEALQSGITLLQLREKNLSDREFAEEAKQMKALACRYQVPLIINDHVQVAMEADADGVHVGQGDMSAKEARRLIGPHKILGVTAKTVEQAVLAQEQGADYLGAGAVFGSKTKTDAEFMDMETLKAICEAVTIPVVAIGGIQSSNIMRMKGSGVSGAAVVSAIFGAKDIPSAVAELLEKSTEMAGHRMNKVLTIAGSDCSGGAGIQADLKTMTALGIYGMSVITALTAQNTTGVYGIADTEPEFVEKQLDCVFTDIVPDAVKIGMVSGKELIGAIAGKLVQYQAQHIVLDPVMVSTSGSRLLSEDAVETLKNSLMPLAELVTPNIPEAEILWGEKIIGEEEMEAAARSIGERYRTAVLVKGGHRVQEANDVLYHQGELHWFHAERVDSDNTHGTGCTLSSAIACGLADGCDMKTAIQRAKAYLSRALRKGLDIGQGNGPLNHCIRL